jgi:Micrococcal nuclease (thermonuclease) homologs
MSRRVLIPALLAAIAAAVLALRGGEAQAPASAATIVRVVDGDTVVVRFAGGGVERVRFIGMDTPESVKPGTPVQCFALKASAFTKQLLDGRRVQLVGDVEARDRYGRMLAYVYRVPDGLFVNEELVRRGYAMPMTFPPNVRFRDEIARLARDARAAGRGLWKAC